MKTLKDLKFRKFDNKNDTIMPFAKLTADEFFTSKEPGRGSAKKWINLSGHQIIRAILGLMPQFAMSNVNSVFYVYKDHFSHPGYVTKVNEWDKEAVEITPELPLSELCFDRVIGLISTGQARDGYTQKLGVKYEVEGGVQICFGTMVDVCSNMNIFGGRNIKSSKRDEIGIDELMAQVKDWLADAENIFQSDLDTIDFLQSVSIEDDTEIQQFLIGDMLMQCFGEAPVLQITELSRLAESCRRKAATDFWDFTNKGTELIRFDVGDSEFDRIEAFNHYVEVQARVYQAKRVLHPEDTED